MSYIFSILSAAITIYTLLCFLDIILSWFPGAKFTKFGRFIASITDPYLNLFRGIKWLRVGYLDFSPILALGLLSLASSVLGSIMVSGRFYVGVAIAQLINIIWSLCSSLLGFLLLLIVVRFIVYLVQGGPAPYGSMWTQLDGFLGNIVSKIASPFYKNQNDYKMQLLVSGLVILATIIVGNILFGILVGLCKSIPF